MAEEQKPSSSENILDFLSGADTLEGFEKISAANMAIPFLRIAQALSPQINKQNELYIPGLEAGDFFNNVTGVRYGSEIEVIVLQFDQIYIEWKPNRGGFVQYHSVENAERIATDKTFGKWKTANGNSLSENYVYFVLVKGAEKEGPVVLSLSSSMIKTARQWNRLLVSQVLPNGQRAFPHFCVWNLRTSYVENELGNWFNPVVTFSRFVVKEEYLLLTDERKTLPQRSVNYAELEGGTQKEIPEDTAF